MYYRISDRSFISLNSFFLIAAVWIIVAERDRKSTPDEWQRFSFFASRSKPQSNHKGLFRGILFQRNVKSVKRKIIEFYVSDDFNFIDFYLN